MTRAPTWGVEEGEEPLLPFSRQTERQATRTDTSDAAFRRAERERNRAKVIALFRSHPLTCDEVMAFTGLPHQTASPAINSLMRDGIIVPTGEKRLTARGRMAKVWRFEANPKPIHDKRPTRKQLEKRIESAIALILASKHRHEVLAALRGTESDAAS